MPSLEIVHFCSSIDLAHGGVVRAVLDICDLMAKAGHRITLLTCDDKDVPTGWHDAQNAAVPRALTIARPGGPLKRFGDDVREIVRPIVERADVLHLHTPWETANLDFARIAREAGVPYVISIHGMLDDWSMAQRRLKKRLYLALVGRRLLERAFCVHCTASAEERQAKRWFLGGRGRVIPLIFDLGPYRELPGSGLARAAHPEFLGDTPIVLFLSRLHYKKGVELLIEAAGQLRRGGRAFLLVVAGSGEPEYVESLHRLVRDRDLEGVTLFTGLVVGDEKVSLYEAADLFVLPTSQENFGFVFPEALASRTPVITTRGVDIWPELEGSGGAIIVDRSPAAIADAIDGLLADPERRRQMGEAGRAWVLRTFESDQILGEFESMYREAAATGTRHAK